MKKKTIIVFVCLIFIGTLVSFRSDACTHFQLQAKDGAILIGRSMEFAQPLKSEIVSHPRGETITSSAPQGKPGLKWTSSYGYLAVNALGLNTAVDGLNETGLSIGGLWLPNDTEYPSVSAGQQQRALSVIDFGSWLLGNFATVAEVKQSLGLVTVWGPKVAELQGMVPPLHYAIHDATGAAIVVEFIGGEMKIHDNPNGVLTNSPPFDWQIINLKNYVNLKALNAKPIDLSGMVLGQAGQGSGLLGIPGDWTPPSRFVRATVFKEFAKPAENSEQGVNLANHLLNTVDIPLGVIREKNAVADGDYTQWVVIKDLTNKMLYFRSYENLSLRAIDLKKLELKVGAAPQSVPVHGGNGIEIISFKAD